MHTGHIEGGSEFGQPDLRPIFKPGTCTTQKRECLLIHNILLEYLKILF